MAIQYSVLYALSLMAFRFLNISNADIVAIQSFADEHGHPVGMMSKLFDNLYHDEVGFSTLLLLFFFLLF